MKLRELFSEGKSKFTQDAQDAVSNMRVHDQLDNSDPYDPWRFGIALAGMPHHKMPKHGPVGSKLVTATFTKEEDDMIRATEKHMGFKGANITSNGSKELNSVNHTSPINKPKPNKYGI